MKTILRKELVFFTALFCIGIAQAQITVSGTVSDAAGPLPGANIVVKGTNNGAQTDFDGNYTLSGVAEDAVLVFSYIGFKNQEIPVNGQSTIDVTLQEDTQALDEVVVVGYGTLKKKEITSAVASVKAKDFNQGGARSPMDLVQGKVAGLNITRTQGNNPNSGASIQLRGVTSLKGTRSPLVVIDGIPGGNLDLLQQDDIESIDVLKDGSAAAIYGTRGNAGVILITTKKGKAGDPRFEYNTYFQREFVDEKPDYLSASEFRDLISQGVISEDQDFGYNVDLYDELIDKQNLSQYHNFSASGGSEKSNYRASLYYNDANGIAKENGREQFGGRVNFNQRGLQDRLHLQVNMAANFNKANLLGGGYELTDRGDWDKTTGSDFEQAIQRNPTAPVYNEDGSFYETEGYNNYNPLSRLAHRKLERDQQTFSGDARLTLDIIDGLSASAFGSYVRNTYNTRHYRSTKDWDQIRNYQGTGYASKFNYLNWSKTFETTINYNKTFGDHTIAALAGYSYQYSTTETFNAYNNGFTNDGFMDWDLGSGDALYNDQRPNPGMGSFKEDNRLIAFFGRVNYSFMDKYFAQVILRREGSSRFGANHKWGNFPAASVGWAISEEDFMSNIPEISNLKLRIGYGVTGNQGIPNYQSLVSLSTGGVYPQYGTFYQTYGARRNPNPDLRWEEKKEWNFGLDFGVLDNRISGSLDVYNRLTTDLLYDYFAQQPSFVHDRIYTNVGSLRNKGVEIVISATPIQKDDFSWNVDFAANSQINELEQLSNDVFNANWLEFAGLPSPGNLGPAIRLEEGGAVGNFYGKRFAGFTDDGKWLFYKADGSTGLASEMNENDLTVIGNGVPKYQASLNNTLTYKNFDLTIFFRGKFDFDILNTKDMYFGNKKWLPNNLLKSAVTTHDQLDDDPQYSDYYIEKGDFVKLDNITLGYNFDLKTKYIRNMRVYITGRNIATFTGYSGIDPELEDTGFEPGIDSRGFYPRTKSWTIGLNVGF
ncbi:SusC/RagA family TonB-linked outer membrane protein [Sinomicrobium weinanense]|uniref:TonB-dependent receptor n=1 Tax=Sinomicrobium weinanense TaxID=2842200 RepID=A0A926Q2Y8_9FLAO|nr:TonB-dependent receptor [Sinomicrobium weinanense]MBC9795446.1 TonB-dependent receptor [Sinomicrobium weinanense]MBU3123971.1 TonB-dependent receptor [Sinomicrobium weinanense]